jgi:hypothetical protein
MKQYQKYLNEVVYQPDVESDDLPLEYAKHIIVKYLEMALVNGVKELVDDEEIPSGPDEMVQQILDQIIPKIQKFVASGNLPIA